MKINKLIYLFLISTSIFAQDMKMEIQKPLENLIVINIIPDEDSDSWNHDNYESASDEKENYDFHRVKKGEYLLKIANIHNKKVNKLAKINELKNPDLIYPKQKIYLKNKKPFNKAEIPEYHIVQAGENIIEIAYFYEIDFKELIRLNNLKELIIYPNQKLKLKE